MVALLSTQSDAFSFFAIHAKRKQGRVQRNLKDLASCLELFLQSFEEIENEVYKVLSEWKLENLKEKFKSKEICRFKIYMYSNLDF